MIGLTYNQEADCHRYSPNHTTVHSVQTRNVAQCRGNDNNMLRLGLFHLRQEKSPALLRVRREDAVHVGLEEVEHQFWIQLLWLCLPLVRSLSSCNCRASASNSCHCVSLRPQASDCCPFFTTSDVVVRQGALHCECDTVGLLLLEPM